MTNEEEISVIVTIYNTEQYLTQCVDSILNQSYRNLEVLLIDDGSTDFSGKICDKYADADKRVKVIHKENEGVVKARKVGCQMAHGKYISIIDSDDWLDENMYQELYSLIKTNNVDVAMCGRYEEYIYGAKKVPQGIPAGKYNKNQLLEEVYPRMIVNGDFFSWGIFPSYWDKLFRKDVIIPSVMSANDTIPMGNDAAGVYPDRKSVV